MSDTHLLLERHRTYLAIVPQRCNVNDRDVFTCAMDWEDSLRTTLGYPKLQRITHVTEVSNSILHEWPKFKTRNIRFQPPRTFEL